MNWVALQSAVCRDGHWPTTQANCGHLPFYMFIEITRIQKEYIQLLSYSQQYVYILQWFRSANRRSYKLAQQQHCSLVFEMEMAGSSYLLCDAKLRYCFDLASIRPPLLDINLLMWLSAKEPKRKDIPFYPSCLLLQWLCSIHYYYYYRHCLFSFFHYYFFSPLNPFISSKAGPNIFEAATSGVASFVKIQSAFWACFLSTSPPPPPRLPHPPFPSSSVAARRGNIEQSADSGGRRVSD